MLGFRNDGMTNNFTGNYLVIVMTACTLSPIMSLVLDNNYAANYKITTVKILITAPSYNIPEMPIELANIVFLVLNIAPCN